MSNANATAWTTGVARLVSVGGLCIDSRGTPSVEDIYKLLLEPGTRPRAGETYGIPGRGTAHPDADTVDEYAGLVVKSVSFSQPDPTSMVWTAKVKYGPKNSTHADQEEEPEEDDPIAEAQGWTRAKISTAHFQREFIEDAEGTPVLNSAGDPFDNPPQADVRLLQISLSATAIRPPLSKIAEIDGTVNSANLTVLGFEIEAGKGLIELEADKDFAQGTDWRISCTITVNPAGWDMKILQNGFRFKDADGNLVKFTEKTEDGKEIDCTTPMPLTEDGGDGRGGEPAYATFKPYVAASWAALDLPTGASDSDFVEPTEAEP